MILEIKFLPYFVIGVLQHALHVLVEVLFGHSLESLSELQGQQGGQVRKNWKFYIVIFVTLTVLNIVAVVLSLVFYLKMRKQFKQTQKMAAQNIEL